MKHAFLAAIALLLVASAVRAQATAADTTIKVIWGAFVDGYYAWDFQRPATFDRSFAGGTSFTTQPARHNEFNVNLAYIEVRADGQRVRGRLALQTGTSVQSNYSGEPTNGQVSGPSLSRLVQEAVAGIKIADNVWIDGGIFFSHLGMEGWVSRDNLTYTRSLVGDYSPYYQSGAKITWAATPKLTAQLDVVNGWQNISENNAGKGVGARLDFALSPNTTLSYYNLVSQEAGTKLRLFNGVGTKATVGRTTLLGEADIGRQDDSDGNRGAAVWYGFTAVARVQLTPIFAAVARAERFDDPHQVIIGTGSFDSAPNGAFQGNGGSVGLDWMLQSHVMWRTELRGFQNAHAVFPNGATGRRSTHDGFVVTSLALTF
jgi:hypothetical protein